MKGMVRRKRHKPKKVPAKRGSVDHAYRSFAVALENVYTEMNAMGEAVDLLREQTDSRFDTLEELIRQLDKRVTVLEVKVGELANDTASIKHEIRLIRHDLTQKVNREEFDILQERVGRLEKELQVR